MTTPLTVPDPHCALRRTIGQVSPREGMRFCTRAVFMACEATFAYDHGRQEQIAHNRFVNS